MKIYTYVRINIDTGEIVSSESYEYSGAVALCKGGSGQSPIDKEYNKRMADISEQELKMAQEYFNFWKTDYKPFEQEQIKQNMMLLPHLTQTQIDEAKVKQEQYQGLLKKDKNGQNLIGLQQEEQRQLIQQNLELMPQQTQVAKEAYNAALRGVDENAAADRARADVALSFGQSETDLRRDLSRAGIGASGEQYTAAAAGLARDRAKSMAGAMTTARTTANNEEFSRLSGLMKR